MKPAFGLGCLSVFFFILHGNLSSEESIRKLKDKEYYSLGVQCLLEACGLKT
jgi:hypothetical protein